MNVLLVWLIAEKNVEFMNHRAEVQKVDAQVYVKSDGLDEFLERMRQHGFAYIIPDKTDLDIYIHDEKHESLKQHPNHRNAELDYWSKIESHLPKYHSRQDVCDSNDYCKIIEDEMEDDEYHNKIVEDLMWDQPKYLTKKEWAFHQMADLDTEMFYEACEV